MFSLKFLRKSLSSLYTHAHTCTHHCRFLLIKSWTLLSCFTSQINDTSHSSFSRGSTFVRHRLTIRVIALSPGPFQFPAFLMYMYSLIPRPLPIFSHSNSQLSSCIASSPGHSQYSQCVILCVMLKSGSGLGTRLRLAIYLNFGCGKRKISFLAFTS